MARDLTHHVGLNSHGKQKGDAMPPRLTTREKIDLALKAEVDLRTFQRYLTRPASTYRTGPRARIESLLRSIGRLDLVRQ